MLPFKIWLASIRLDARVLRGGRCERQREQREHQNYRQYARHGKRQACGEPGMRICPGRVRDQAMELDTSVARTAGAAPDVSQEFRQLISPCRATLTVCRLTVSPSMSVAANLHARRPHEDFL